MDKWPACARLSAGRSGRPLTHSSDTTRKQGLERLKSKASRGRDWARNGVVVPSDLTGKIMDERVFPHGGAGLAALCDWLVSVGGDPSIVAVAIEVPHGPVVDALLDRGFAVHAITPSSSTVCATVSALLAPRTTGGMLELPPPVRTDPQLFRPVQIGDPAVIKLREWSRLAQELQQERVRLGNRIRQQLCVTTRSCSN